MTTPNDAASEAMVEAGAEAATDVTGFGLFRPPAADARVLRRGRQDRRLVRARAPRRPRPRDEATWSRAGRKRNHAYLGPNVDWGALDARSSWCSRTRRPPAGC